MEVTQQGKCTLSILVHPIFLLPNYARSYPLETDLQPILTALDKVHAPLTQKAERQEAQAVSGL